MLDISISYEEILFVGFAAIGFFVVLCRIISGLKLLSKSKALTLLISIFGS